MKHGTSGSASAGNRISNAQNSARSVRKVVQSVLDSRIEHKRITAVGVPANLATAGVVNTISMGIAQGDDIGNRAGDLIRPKKLKIRADFSANGAAAGLAFVGRIIVFQDLLCNGAVPAVTDILNSASHMSGWNPVTRQERRFKVLYDRDVTPSSQSAKQIVYLSVDLDMKGTIHYITNGSNAAAMGKNHIFALFISSAASAGNIVYEWSYDFEYTDA